MWKILLSLLLCMSFLPFGQASANTTFTSVSAGNEHTVAIDSTGSVWAWGSNMNGSLGDGTTTAHLRPIKVPGLTDITAISASGNFTLALKNDGTVYAWGMNYNGQLGNGTSNNVQLVPLQIPGLDHVIAIEAGNGYSMALKDDGKVYTWGLNNNGQLGDGTTDSKSTPVQVLNISNAKKISAGHSHAMALIDDKTVYAWGDNQVGQIGNGTINARQLTPVKIGISGITSISAGGAHSLAVKEDGTVYGWGRNVIGEVGDGTTNMRALPVVINSLTGIGITSVETGTTHSLAIQNDGTVWGWGDNQFGQLGDESSTPRLTPVKMKTSKAATIISSSFVHSMIVYNDGTIWGTGRNNGGQLGIGSYSDSNKLVQVAFASTDANLSNLVLSTGQLTPPFSSNTTSYTMNVNNEVESISLTPTASSANATITVTVNSGNPINVTSGQQFGPFALNVGENQVSVKVTAEDGLQTKTYTVVITRAPINHAPVANAGSYQTTQDVAVTGTLIATDSDSDPLTYSIVSNGSLGVVNITNTATGAFTYTPNNGATGDDSFTFRVYDGKVYSNTATVTVSIEPPTPSNQVPTAQNDSFATTMNTPVSGILRASDPDSDPLTYSIDQNGTKGTATITNSTTGAFTYTPNNGATGNDSFTFRVYDGKVYSNTATVAVSIEPPTPSNQVPTAQNDSFATTVNTPVSGILRASDPDSDPLTYSIDQNGTKGTATITNSTTGAFTYVPNAGETGNDSFTFRVNDGHSSSNLATISITISNSTPPPYYPVTDVILDKTRVELQAGGEPITLHATIKPSNASNQQVIWSSSNQLVASVDQQGKVTPLMAGEAVITVTSLDRNISDICRIVVKAQTTPVTKIVLDKTNVDTEEYGTPFKIKATVFPENATNQKIVWSSSNEKVAVVDQTGNVTPLAKGTAIIKAKTEDRNKEAKCVVKVKKGQLVGIEVPEQNLHLVINKTKVLKVYATLNDGSKKDITKEKETTIENLSPDLVTIKKNVIKAGKNEGIAKIKVTYKNQTTTFNVIVSKVGVSKLIASDKEVSLGKGESKQISVQALLTDKTSIPVTELATWSSDQSDIVSVKAGVITAHKKGTAKMKAIYGGKNVTITVKVK